MASSGGIRHTRHNGLLENESGRACRCKEKRTMKPGDVAVIPGGVEHEGYFTEDSEVIDFFAPVREDFLSGAPPSYMRAS